MSEDNVEIVRRMYDAVNRYSGAKARGDQDAVAAIWDTTQDWLAPDFEFREDPSWPGAQTYRGLERCREVWDDYYEQFGEQTVKVEKFVESGDQVVVLLRWKVRGVASGAPVDMAQGHVHTLRNGRVTKWEVYFDRSAALEAAGLSE